MFILLFTHTFYLVLFQVCIIQLSKVTPGPRRGPTLNNRWWNDRRSWNLRITNRREEASPKGANHILFCYCSPPSGRLESVSAIRRFHSLRSFHPRLFTFAPFGDGRMPLTKLQSNISIHSASTWVYKSCHFLKFYKVVDAILHFSRKDTLFY